MMGRNRATAPNMIARVSLLEEASQMVRLAWGSEEDGNKNGNKAKPAAAIVPTGTKAELRKATIGVLRIADAPRAPKPATMTGVHCQGPNAEFASHPAPRVTALAMGFDGAS